VFGWQNLDYYATRGWKPQACARGSWPEEMLGAKGRWAAYCLAVHEFAHVLQGVRNDGFRTTAAHGAEWQAALKELIDTFVRPAIAEAKEAGLL